MTVEVPPISYKYYTFVNVRKRHHKNRSSPERGRGKFSVRTLERFFLNYGLGISGILILILGLFYLVTIHFGNDTFINLIQSFLKPNPENEITPVYRDFSLRSFLSLTSFTFPGVLGLIFLYIPGVIPLILLYFLPSRKPILKNSLILLGFLWLIFVQGKVFLYNAYVNGSFFQDFYSAFNFFLVVQVILILISVLNKNRLALNLSVIFFFISIVFIRSYYGGMIPFFLVLILFQITVFSLSLLFRWRSPFLSTMLVSAFYLTFYICRKIIFAGNPQPVSFMLPALLVWFVISVTGLGILKPTFRQKNSSVLWDTLSYLALFLVIGTGASMILISGMNTVYQIYTVIVTAALIIIAVLNEKYNFLKSKKTFYYLVCIFSAFLIPQLLFSQFFLVLAASLSVTLLFHAHLTHSRTSFNMSKILFFIMIALYMVEWVISIVPALIHLKTTSEIYSFHLVLVTLLISSISFFYVRLTSYVTKVYPFLQKQTILPSNIPLIVLPFIIYSSFFLMLNYALITLFPGYFPGLVEMATLTYASVLLIYLMNPSISGSVIIFRIVLALLAIALYPAIINSEVSRNLTLFLEGNSISLIPFIIHFICLGLMILLLLHTNGMLRQFYRGIIKTHIYRDLILVILGTYILLTEYDHFSLLWFSHAGNLHATEILRSNKLIPYSLILLLISVTLLIYSNIRYSRFLRRVSLVMILSVIIKIFILDLKIAEGNLVVIILVSVGLTLIGVALIIRRIRKKRNNPHRRTSSEVITIH